MVLILQKKGTYITEKGYLLHYLDPYKQQIIRFSNKKGTYITEKGDLYYRKGVPITLFGSL